MADRREVLAEAIAVAKRRYNEAASELQRKEAELASVVEAITALSRERDEALDAWQRIKTTPSPRWAEAGEAEKEYRAAEAALSAANDACDELDAEVDSLYNDSEPERRELYRLQSLMASMRKRPKPEPTSMRLDMPVVTVSRVVTWPHTRPS